MPLKKKDFIEIEFTGRVKDGEVFDSNIKEDVAKLHSHAGQPYPIETKPFIFCLGEKMFLQAIDDFLIGKPDTNFPTNYEIELSPDKAFGIRDPKLINKVPSRIFRENDVNPVSGMAFNFDGRIGKILTVSGGRITVDFNNPLAGKNVVYKIKILRKVTDINEKIRAFVEFLFKKTLDFEVKDKKIILRTEKKLFEFANLFKEKFKELFGLELQVEEVQETATKSEKSKPENKDKD